MNKKVEKQHGLIKNTTALYARTVSKETVSAWSFQGEKDGCLKMARSRFRTRNSFIILYKSQEQKH